MHPLFGGADYRMEVTIVRAGADDRDVHIPVLGDDPYVTIELADSPAAESGLPAQAIRIRTGRLAETPAELGAFLVAIGTQLMEADHAGH